MTVSTRQVARPQRWDRPFDEAMDDSSVARILATPPFDAIDPALFPPSVPLQGILRNDARIRRYQAGDLVCVRGEYGNSAFFILEGEVRVVVGEGLPEALLGRAPTRPKGWWRAIGQLWRNHAEAEVRALGLAPLVSGGEGQARLRLADPERVLREYDTIPLPQGQLFGEIAAMARVPRNASVLVPNDAELLEIRWQGLRELRRRSRELRTTIDELYRNRSLQTLLLESPLLRGLPDETLRQLAAEAIFESHGDFEWQAGYRASGGGVASEPLIAEQGHYADGLLLVSGGFARVTERHHSGRRTLALLRRGDLFGLDDALAALRGQGNGRLSHSLHALGYVDLVRLPLHLLRHALLEQSESSPLKVQTQRPLELEQELLEFFVEHRYINGTATMLVDLDRCTRCDDCVSACARAHDGNPRFLRQGRNLDRFMVAGACMHCTDPVCMIGCPTGAIHRDRDSGLVSIADTSCIGCGTCGNSCPYDAIRMVEIHDPQGQQLVDPQGLPLLKATKCDLCLNQPVPAQCEYACPHDALKRVDLRDLDRLQHWVAR